MDAKLLLLTN